MEKIMIGQVSDEQIQQWKKEFGNVWEVSVENSVCYLKKASRATLRAALTFLEKDKLKYMEVIIANCWLAGDESIKTDDDKFYSLTSVVPDLTQAKEAEIKKH